MEDYWHILAIQLYLEDFAPCRRPLSCGWLLGGLLACWLAGLLACWLACCACLLCLLAVLAVLACCAWVLCLLAVLSFGALGSGRVDLCKVHMQGKRSVLSLTRYWSDTRKHSWRLENSSYVMRQRDLNTGNEQMDGQTCKLPRNSVAHRVGRYTYMCIGNMCIYICMYI